jgi:hypothetical protein
MRQQAMPPRAMSKGGGAAADATAAGLRKTFGLN